ncbi:MAG: alpha/beta fold hydrolase [Nitrospirae bacterium]|nr:alpha/beta fold hydrolase [Nitrospirota bacterium]
MKLHCIYEEALTRIEELQAKDDAAINHLCRTQFLMHGKKTNNAIVLLHGFTNCPQQFASLGKTFFDHGFNVLIPRIPRHGFADRLTKEPARTSAEEMVAFTVEVVDIVQGLGDHVTVMGLSGGGVMTAWAAQYRSDVDNAIIIAPNFAYKLIPKNFTRVITGVALTIPNIFIWWDDKLRLNTKPDYAYPRFSTRAIAEVTRLGYAIRSAAKKTKPLAKSIVMVLNETDEAVDNDVPLQLAESWRANGGEVRDTVFKAEMRLKHDLIDPNQPYQRIDVVYPILMELVKG